MTESGLPEEPFDPTADTGRFQAFVDGEPDPAIVAARPAAAGVPFRVGTLIGGLVVLGVLVVLLFLL
ncbi:MAG TPA: hypothetical protein VM324_09885 [Egibacteraceae bacterium]|nr:hypothetical protein [Egibacteraceae bacterium]